MTARGACIVGKREIAKVPDKIEEAVTTMVIALDYEVHRSRPKPSQIDGDAGKFRT